MRTILSIIFSLAFCSSYGQYQQTSMLTDTAFVYIYGGPGRDYARHIIATSDTGYLVVGTTSSYGEGNTDLYLIKTDRDCNREWSHIYGTPSIEWGYAAKETYDNGFIISGYTNQNITNGYDMYLMKINSSGAVQWSKTIGDADWDFGYAIELSADSGFIICGKTYSPSNGGTDVLIVKTDSFGNIVWKKNYGGTGDESANTIYKTVQGDYLILGETDSYGAGDKDFYLLKIDENGDTLWTKTYGTPKFDAGYAIDTSTSGNYFLLGTSEGNPALHGKDINLFKINSSGDVIWSEFDGGFSDEEGRFVLQLPDSDYIFGGMSSSFGLGGKSLYMLGIFNAGGYMGANWGGTQDEEGYDITLGKDGRIVFAGTTMSELYGYEDVYLIRIDSLLPNGINYPLSMHYYNDSLVSVDEIGAQNNNLFSIYPNPFHSVTTVEIKTDLISDLKNSSISITDIAGRIVKTMKVNHFPFHMENNGEFKAGSYFISVYIDNHLYSTDKLIIY